MPTKRPQLLGITGGIATGKSTVLTLIEAAGIPTCSADALAKELFLKDPDLRAFLEWHEVWDNDPAQAKKKFWAKAFQDEGFFRVWSSLIQPKIRAALLGFIQEHADAPWVALEIPLLFEKGWAPICARILVTDCARAIQEARFLERPGATLEQLVFLETNQWPIEQKIAAANFVIQTNPGCDIKEDIDLLLKTLQRDAP